MEYSNYAQAKFVCEKIAEHEKLLCDLKTAEEIRFQLPSGYHIKTIQCGIKCEPDYAIDSLAKQFKNAVIAETEQAIESLKNELKPL